MDVLTIGRIVLRRWYVVLIGILLTAAAVYAVATNIEPTYESSGSFLLTSPDMRGEGAPDLGVVAHLANAEGIIHSLTTGTTPEAFTEDVDGGSYTIFASPDGSVLTVEAVADRPEGAVTIAGAVVAAIHDEVAQQQAAVGISDNSRRISRTLQEPSVETATLAPDTATGGAEAGAYLSSGSVLIVDPPEGTANPYASSTFTLRVLEETLMSPLVYASTLDGRETTYELAQVPRDVAPILYVTASGADPDEVQATFAAVVDRTRAELANRQEAAGVGPSSLMSLEPLSVPTAPQLASTNLKRPLAAALGLGGMATLALVLVSDRALGSRARRRRRRRHVEGETEVKVEPRQRQPQRS